jgi:hypothetical protein
MQQYIERDTAGATQRVEDAEAAIRKEQDNTEAAQNAGLTTRELENQFHKMIATIGDSRSDVSCSNNGNDADDVENEETEQGQLSEDDDPGWVMDTITETL